MFKSISSRMVRWFDWHKRIITQCRADRVEENPFFAYHFVIIANAFDSDYNFRCGIINVVDGKWMRFRCECMRTNFISFCPSKFRLSECVPKCIPSIPAKAKCERSQQTKLKCTTNLADYSLSNAFSVSSAPTEFAEEGKKHTSFSVSFLCTTTQLVHPMLITNVYCLYLINTVS